MRIVKTYVNIPEEENAFWGYEKDEKGFFFLERVLTEEEKAAEASAAWCEYFAQFSEKELMNDLY